MDAKSSSQDALHTGQGVLNMRQTVGEAGLKPGDTVNLQLMQTMVASDDAIMGDRSVITWGNLGFRGDSSIVQAQPRNAHHIQNTACAFNGILENGGVVGWGNSDSGGDSSSVHLQFTNCLRQFSCICCHKACWLCSHLGGSRIWR